MERPLRYLAVVVAAVGAAVVTAGCNSSRPMSTENVARGFVGSVAAGNLDRARDFLDISMNGRAYSPNIYQAELTTLEEAIQGCVVNSTSISVDRTTPGRDVQTAAVQFQPGCGVRGVLLPLVDPTGQQVMIRATAFQTF